MNKLVGKLMVMCVLALSLNAFAQSTAGSNQDSMKHDDMKQDTMKKDRYYTFLKIFSLLI